MKNYLREYLNNRPLFISIIRHREAELFEQHIPFKEPVLDLGCGDGFFAQLIYSKNKKIDVGLDMYIPDLYLARKRGVYKKVVSYGGKKIPFKDNHFSSVFSNCVLEHIPDIYLSISEIGRVLKPGGIFATTVMTAKWEEYLFGNKILGDAYKKWMREKQVHPSLLSRKEWQKVFKNNGFKIVEEIGYMDKRSSQWMDVLHYFSVDSLISKKLFNKWIVFPQRYDIFPVEKWIRSLQKNVKPEDSAALFYVLKKTS